MRVRKFHGLYQAKVISNSDPENLQRLQVLVPSVSNDNLPLALACIPLGASELPAVGSTVWIMFEGADVNRPVWIGTLPSRV